MHHSRRTSGVTLWNATMGGQKGDRIMEWHYDLTQAEPIIRDLPVGGAVDILKGAGVARIGAISTALNHFCYQLADEDTLDDFIGVANEFYDYSAHISNTGANAATAAATGVTNYIKVIINPMAVWLTEYSQHADNDTVNTAADSTGKTVTGTFTSPGDDQEGNWVYITNVGSTVGGAGNLFQIGDISTTVATACTNHDDYLKGNNTADTYILIYNPYTARVVGGSIDLSAASGEECTKIMGNDLVGTDTGAAITLQNYVTDMHTPMEPLRVERHSGRNFHAATCKIYADLFFTDHLCLGASTADAPLIT